MTASDGARLQEGEAWALVRRIGPGEGPVRLVSDHAEGGALEADGEGRWSWSGTLAPAARGVLGLFLPLARRAEWVVGQMGQSLDGRIATDSGHSHYVTGPEDIRRLHRLRALADAVVVGAGTVASDDPRLTVREVEGADPVRVVLDPTGRVGADRRLFRERPETTLVVRARGVTVPSPPGVEVLYLDASSRDDAEGSVARRHLAPTAVLQALAERGLRRVLVEGGGITVSRFLAAGALDRLQVTVAPLLIGSGRPSVSLPVIDTLDEALRPPCRTFRLGPDVLFDLELRRWRPFALDSGTSEGFRGRGPIQDDA